MATFLAKSTLPSLSPPQVALSKSTQYFANVLDLADILVALIYEQLPTQSFRLRTGSSVKSLTGISELSIATSWNDQYVNVLISPAAKQSLFWQTLYDFLLERIKDVTNTGLALDKIHTYLNEVVTEADGNTTFTVFLQLQLNLINDYIPENSELRRYLSFDDLLLISNFLYRFRTTLSTVLFYDIPKLSFEYPLDSKSDGWKLDVDAIIDIQLPPTPEKFLTWRVDEKGASLFLHFDSITLDDSSGLAVVNPNDDKDGEVRFPFGGTAGDLTLSDVVISLNINGELAKAEQVPVAPYHWVREAYFTERDNDNIVDIQLNVGAVSLGINSTMLGALFSVIGWVDNNLSKEKLEGAIEDGFESLDDFGGVGDTISDALLTPFLPSATALETHDLYKPFVSDHSVFSYDKLTIEGSGRGIHILNKVEEPDPDSGNGGLHFPPTDGVDDPPIYDHADPLPSSSGTVNSPFDYLVPNAAHQATLKSRLDKMTALPAEQEAASRLWLDRFSPRAMCWLQVQNIDQAKGTVYGKPSSPKTISSLARLLANKKGHRTSFVFSDSAERPAAGTMLALAASPFKDNLPQDRVLLPKPVPTFPVQFALESTLAASKGSAIDPFWAGLSMNAVAVKQVTDMLRDSQAVSQAGTISDRGSDLPYSVTSIDTTGISIDLSGSKDRRPVASLSEVIVRLGPDNAQATYDVKFTVPLEVIKQELGCLPDDSLSTVAFHRSCIEGMTEGKIPDPAYLDLLYRHFYCLQFVTQDALLVSSKLTHGSPIHPPKPPGKPNGPPGPLPEPPTIDLGDSLLITQAIRSALGQILPIPILFDTYYSQSTTLKDFEAKDGWLNVYETYQGLPQ